MMKDEELGKERDIVLKEEAARKYSEMTKEMCRRAMLRNGFFLEWFLCFWQDEAIKFIHASFFLFGIVTIYVLILMCEV